MCDCHLKGITHDRVINKETLRLHSDSMESDCKYIMFQKLSYRILLKQIKNVEYRDYIMYLLCRLSKTEDTISTSESIQKSQIPLPSCRAQANLMNIPVSGYHSCELWLICLHGSQLMRANCRRCHFQYKSSLVILSIYAAVQRTF